MDLSEAYSPAAAIIKVPIRSPVEWGGGEIVLERSGCAAQSSSKLLEKVA